MVERTWRLRNSPLMALTCAVAVAGCAVAPKARLDECHQLSRTLQADNARLKDTVLSLRSQNDDLTQREVDDTRRIEVQEREIQRLTASISGYQEERDQLAASYDRLKSLLQTNANPLSAALLRKLEDFARNRPGCDFDPETAALTIAAEQLFVSGTDRLKPEGRSWLQAYAGLVKASEAGAIRLRVAGHTDDSRVERVANRRNSGPQGHLSLDRAMRVREELAACAQIDAAQIEVAGFESSQPRETGPNDTARARNRRIEIQLLAGTPKAVGQAAGP